MNKNDNKANDDKISINEKQKTKFNIFVYLGEDILLPNGEINRAKLGQIVFTDVEKRRILNLVTHPEIHRLIFKQILKHFLLGYNFVVLDLPLLFETGRFLPYIHKIITVTWYVPTDLVFENFHFE